MWMGVRPREINLREEEKLYWVVKRMLSSNCLYLVDLYSGEVWENVIFGIELGFS